MVRDVKEMIRRAVRRFNLDTQYPYSQDISVTSVLYCLRKAYYDYLINCDLIDEQKIEEQFDSYHEQIDRTLEDWYIFVGKTVHSNVQEFIKKAFASERVNIIDEFKVSAPLTENIRLTGHIDILLLEPEKAEIIELKTCARIPDSPYPQHDKQVKTYVHMLSKIFPEFTIDASIVYLQRSGGRIEQFTLVENYPKVKGDVDDTFDYTFRRALKLYNAVVNEEPPEGEYTIQCRNCPYQNRCNRVYI